MASPSTEVAGRRRRAVRPADHAAAHLRHRPRCGCGSRSTGRPPSSPPGWSTTARRPGSTTGRGDGVQTLTTESCWGASTHGRRRLLLRRGRAGGDHRPRGADPRLAGRGAPRVAALHHAAAAGPLVHRHRAGQRLRRDGARPGTRSGLILTQSDPEFTEAPNTGATVTVDLAASRLILPVTGRATLAPALDDARVTTAPIAPAERTAPSYRRQLPQ